jgi:hypothetical protein
MLGEAQLEIRLLNLPSGVPSWRAPGEDHVVGAHISIQEYSIPLMQSLQKLILAEVRGMGGVMRNEGSLMLSHV